MYKINMIVVIILYLVSILFLILIILPLSSNYIKPTSIHVWLDAKFRALLIGLTLTASLYFCLCNIIVLIFLIKKMLFFGDSNELLKMSFTNQSNTPPVSPNINRNNVEYTALKYMTIMTAVGGVIGYKGFRSLRGHFNETILWEGTIVRGRRLMSENPYHRAFVNGAHIASGIGLLYGPMAFCYNVFEKKMPIAVAFHQTFVTTLLDDTFNDVAKFGETKKE